ncbi:MAG TPA: AgmX/PglI C-terminal domain-containing protein [Chitinispirillaceae bacterium]|nr:AgmX/PglI C-terminal domain-containing protein [Chitinispirillaceae bacterium]
MIQEVVLSAGASGYIAMDDDENDVEGRILTTEEFIARLRERGDIFSIDNGKRLLTSEAFAICCAILVGLGLTKMEVAEIRSVGVVDEPVKPSIPGIPHPNLIDRPQVTPPPRVVNVEKRTLHNRVSTNRNGSSVRASGGGDHRARVARMGIFGIQAGVTNGRSSSGDITAPGGFADGIDAIISGVNGLRRGSGGGVARMGPSAIGYGDGVNSGFGPYSPGTDIGPSGDAPELALKLPSVSEKVRPDIPITGVGLNGGRNKSEILKVVMQNIQSLRYAYNQRLRDKPELRGKVVCRFAIDEFGNVLVCDIVESTVLDNVLEAKIKGMISRWRFEKIDKIGDVTEIVYPFVFSS